MTRDRPDDTASDPTVVDLERESEVDWLAEGRRDRHAAFECGDVVQTPDGEGTIIARYVHDQLLGNRKITAGKDSPTYIVKRLDTDEPHPTYDEADLTLVED